MALVCEDEHICLRISSILRLVIMWVYEFNLMKCFIQFVDRSVVVLAQRPVMEKLCFLRYEENAAITSISASVVLDNVE